MTQQQLTGKRLMATVTVLILLITGLVLADETTNGLSVKGKATRLSNEISVIRDANGRHSCAIQVVSPDEEFTYDANNGVIKVDDRPGLDIVYLSPGERVLEIYHTGVTPLKISLSSLGIQSEAKSVWQIELNPLQQTIAEGRGRLNLITEPSGATIEIDGIPGFQTTSPHLYEDLATGKWTFRVSKEGYVTREIEVLVENGRSRTIELKLRPNFGYVKFLFEPDDAEVIIDGVRQQFVSGQTVKIDTGQVNILLRHPYCQTLVFDTLITPEENPERAMPLEFRLQKDTGILSLTSVPANARVYFNGDYAGVTPLSRKLLAGKYELQLRMDGFQEYSQPLEVLAGSDEKVTVNLNQNALLSVTGTEGAVVAIDGQVSGTIPLRNIELRQGDHYILVRKDGYDPEDSFFSVGAEVKEMEFDLARTEGRFFRWAMFDNARLKEVADGALLNYGAYHWLQSSNFRTDLYETYMEKDFEVGQSVAFSVISLPFQYTAEFNWREKETPLDNVLNYHYQGIKTGSGIGEISVVPFAFWERIFPYAGLFYVYSEYLLEASEERSFFEIRRGSGYSAGVHIRLTGVISLTIANRKFLWQDAFRNQYIARLGFWFTSTGTDQPKKTGK